MQFLFLAFDQGWPKKRGFRGADFWPLGMRQRRIGERLKETVGTKNASRLLIYVILPTKRFRRGFVKIH